MWSTAFDPSLTKRINEQNNSCARALQFLVHFFAVLCKATTWNDQILTCSENLNHNLSLCFGFSFPIVLKVINMVNDLMISRDSLVKYKFILFFNRRCPHFFAKSDGKRRISLYTSQLPLKHSSNTRTRGIFCQIWARLRHKHPCLFMHNRPFAGSGHMVRNKLHWDANDAVGLSKQRNSYQSSPTFLCFESCVPL